MRLVAYESQSLQPCEKNYDITELEGLGVVCVMMHFWHCLYGHKCELYPVHVALKALLNTLRPSGSQQGAVWPLQELVIDVFC